MKKFILLLFIVNYLLLNISAQETKQSELLNYASQLRFYSNWNSNESQSKIINLNEVLNSFSANNSRDTLQLIGLYENLATNYSILGNNILSAHYYSKLVQIFPDDAGCRFDYAIELANNNLYQKAQNEIETGLKLDSTESFYLRACGNIYFQQNKLKKAVYYYNKSISVSGPDDNFNYSTILKYVTNIFIDPANKKAEIKSASKDWPYPIIQYLNNDKSEKEIVEIIKSNPDPDKCRLDLCESLYYIGIYNLSIGKKELGFNMLKACVDLKVPAYIEDKMAKRILFKEIVL
jgi:lipoprotein NlpI